jgi:xylan 1,4-beta-xylosidase
MFLRTPKENWYSTGKDGITLQLRPETCAGKGNPSFLARRQQHLAVAVSIPVELDAAFENEKAGLIVFQNEHHFYFLCLALKEGEMTIQLYRSFPVPADPNKMELINEMASPASKNAPAFLKIVQRGKEYLFYVSANGKEWLQAGPPLDANWLSTATAGGFVGCSFAIYATSLGQPSQAAAHFGSFTYEGEDEVYPGKK